MPAARLRAAAPLQQPSDCVFVHGYGFVGRRIETGPRWTVVEDRSGRRWAVPSGDCEVVPTAVWGRPANR